MNDLQKNKAIYQAMSEIARKYFNLAVESDEDFRKFMQEKHTISLKELKKCSSWQNAKRAANLDWEFKTITVETFSCEFSVSALFNKELLDNFRKLAKEKELCFTYEEQLPNKRIGTVEISFNNPANAKLLANHAGKDEQNPALEHVLVEANATTGNIHFVACNGHILSVISNNKVNMAKVPDKNDNVFQALFPVSAWKRICDYAKQNSSVKFEIYRRNEDQKQDTMIAILGNTKIKSSTELFAYPCWQKVIQQNADKAFAIHPSDVKVAQKFIKSLRLSSAYDKETQNIFTSFYRGSDICYFDYFDIENNIQKTASFRLTQPSQHTIGVCFKIQQLQKMKFTGFRIEESNRAIVVDCEEADCMVVMPVINDDGYVFHLEEREKLSQFFEVA